MIHSPYQLPQRHWSRSQCSPCYTKPKVAATHRSPLSIQRRGDPCLQEADAPAGPQFLPAVRADLLRCKTFATNPRRRFFDTLKSPDRYKKSQTPRLSNIHLDQSQNSSWRKHSHITNSADNHTFLLNSFPKLTQPHTANKPVKHHMMHHIETTGPPTHAKARRLAPERYKQAKAEFESNAIRYHPRRPK